VSIEVKSILVASYTRTCKSRLKYKTIYETVQDKHANNTLGKAVQIKNCKS